MNERQPLLAVPALITALANARQDPSVLFLGSRLELTLDQQASLRRILEAQKPALVDLASRLRDAHRRMVDDCVCLQATPETIHLAKTRVQDLAEALMEEIGRSSLAIEAILDPAQLARTALFREDATARIAGIRAYLSALWPQVQGPPVHGWAMVGSHPSTPQGVSP
jgi:hypothetical protein